MAANDQSIVEDWLKALHLGHYAESFIDNGYDDLEICKQIGEPDLDAIGVSNPIHRQTILQAVRTLLEQGGTAVYFTLEENTTNGPSATGVNASPPVAGSAPRAEISDDYESSYLLRSPAAAAVTPGASGDTTTASSNYGGSSASYGSCPYESPLLAGRRFLDEYEEGKAELVRFPKMQLKMMLRDKLVRDGIRLSAQPYSNPDGSRGNLEPLATRYAEELHTHYQEISDRLEELRRRRVAIDFPPPPLDGGTVNTLHPSETLKPGKYLPSSCLSDHEEESIYGLFRGPTMRGSKDSPQRCLSPRSRFFYEPCPFPAAGESKENSSTESGDHSKTKRGVGLGRLFRSLGNRKEKASPKHASSKTGTGTICTNTTAITTTTKNVQQLNSPQKLQIGPPLPQLQPGDVLLGDEEHVQLMMLVRDGLLTMEEAVQRIRQKEAEKAACRETFVRMHERGQVLSDLSRGVFWTPVSNKKGQAKETAVFYSDIFPLNSIPPHGHHIYYEPPDDLLPDHEVVPPAGIKTCHPARDTCAACTEIACRTLCRMHLSPKRTNGGIGLTSSVPAPCPTCFSPPAEYTSTLVARTQHQISATRCSPQCDVSPLMAKKSESHHQQPATACGGDCGNIMCSITPETSTNGCQNAATAMSSASTCTSTELAPPQSSPVTPVTSCTAGVTSTTSDTSATTTTATSGQQTKVTARRSSIDGSAMCGESPTGECTKRCSGTSCGSGCSAGRLEGSESGLASVQRRRASSDCCVSSPAGSVRDSLDSNKTEGGGDYLSSPILERRVKSSVFGRLRNLASRSSYSASEEGQSQSSDYEDQDELEKKTEGKLSRDASGRSNSSIVGRVRGFHRDVKKRFSKLKQSKMGSESESRDGAEQSEPIIQPGSSVESIPSGSGGSRSSEDDLPPYVGPIVGRAKALVDYTPSPYDRDALAFKKGDIISIISKNNTGTWIGMVHGRVGHFKFINVKEMSDDARSRQRRPKRYPRWASEENRPQNLEELLREIGMQDYLHILALNGYEDLDSFKEIEKEDLDSLGIVNPEHRLKLLKAAEILIDLDESPGSESPLQDQEEFVTEVDQKQDAEAGLDPESQWKHSPRDSGCYASNENLLHKDGSSQNSTAKNQQVVQEGDDQDSNQTESGIHSSEGQDSSTTINNLDVSLPLHSRIGGNPSEESVAQASKTASAMPESEEAVAPGTAVVNYEPNIPPNQSSRSSISSSDLDNGTQGWDSSSSLRTGHICLQQESCIATHGLNGEIPGSITSCAATIAMHKKNESVYPSERKYAFTGGWLERNGSMHKYPAPTKCSVPTEYAAARNFATVSYSPMPSESIIYPYATDHRQYNSLVPETWVGLEDSPIHTSCGSSFAKRVKSATLPRKKVQDQDGAIVSGDAVSGPAEKKGHKKLSSGRKGQLQHAGMRTVGGPLSVSLITAVARKLEEEAIDLTQEPYTDRTGFCGIPPSLVQRYSEELQRDVYDVAEALDQVRINALKLRGIHGVPNDFLADSCNGPVAEANYSNLHDWLISLGLPMYEGLLARVGCRTLEHAMLLRDADLRACGIGNPRHVRLLTTAIGALHIHMSCYKPQ